MWEILALVILAVGMAVVVRKLVTWRPRTKVKGDAFVCDTCNDKGGQKLKGTPLSVTRVTIKIAVVTNNSESRINFYRTLWISRSEEILANQLLGLKTPVVGLAKYEKSNDVLNVTPPGDMGRCL